MSAPNSNVDICNLALSLLKQQKGTNIDIPETPVEVVCSLWYDQSRRCVLRSHPWNFAIKRVQLAPNATDPVFGFEKAFDLPNDFLRLLTLGTNSNITDYEMENNQILIGNTVLEETNILPLRYVYDITTVVSFDPIFIQALAVEIAFNMAFQFTGNSALTNALNTRRDFIMQQAESIDGQERPPIRRERSSFVVSRTRQNLRTFDNPKLYNF